MYSNFYLFFFIYKIKYLFKIFKIIYYTKYIQTS